MPAPAFKMGSRGIKKLSRTMFALSKDMKKDRQKAILKVASNILKDAKNFAPHRTGALKRSGRLIPHKSGVIVAFGGRGTGVDYAPFVEFGRAPGRMPPPGELESWANAVSGNANNAFVIALSIARSGVAPKPFLRPAVRKNRASINALFKKNFRRSWDKAVRRVK